MSTSPTARGTYRESDGTPVQFADALRAWTRAGYDVLLETATDYNATITYKELAEHVQATSGIRTNTTTANLVGKVLELCATQAAPPGRTAAHVPLRQGRRNGRGRLLAHAHGRHSRAPADHGRLRRRDGRS